MRNLEYFVSVASLMHSILEIDPNCTLRELLLNMEYVLCLQHKHLTYCPCVDWYDESEFYF